MPKYEAIIPSGALRIMLGFSSKSWIYFSFAVIYCSDEILRDISIIKFPRIYLLKFAAVSETEHNSSNLLKLQVVITDFSNVSMLFRVGWFLKSVSILAVIFPSE